MKHIAIIPDGNRRWAKKNNLCIKDGHKKGIEMALEVCKELFKQDIKEISLWLFSTDNWKRSKEEIKNLFILYTIIIAKCVDYACNNDISIKWAGLRDRIPAQLRNVLLQAEKVTKGNNKIFNLCIDYGGEEELKRGLDNLYISTKVDLLVRTSGEQRTSGFLPYQSLYAELYFIKKHCPELVRDDAIKIIKEYKSRNRRLGK